jgi:hypothetical protein
MGRIQRDLLRAGVIKGLSIVGIYLLTFQPEEGNAIRFRNVVRCEIMG